MNAIITLGGAIVDIIAKTEEDFLVEWGMNKGGMQLVDKAGMAKLYDAIGAATEISGGSAANTAVGIASLGGEVGFIGKIAKDSLGRIFTHDITQSGVAFSPCYADDNESTASSIVLITPDAQRTMATYLGAATHLTPDDIDPKLIESADWVYLEGYMIEALYGVACFEYIASLAAANKTRIALSLSDAWCVERNREKLLDFIKAHVDLLFGNALEAEALIGKKDQADLSSLASLASEVVITKSSEGSLVITPSGEAKIKADKSAQVVDTTGAGDIYAAGYLYARHRGDDIKDAMQIATIVASEIISHVGARPQVSLKELIA